MELQQLMDKMVKVTPDLMKRGRLWLFALNQRPELNQWDILVSADWVDYEVLRDNISAIFQDVKKEFNGQFSILFSEVHPLTDTEPIVRNVTSAFTVTGGPIVVENTWINDLKIEKMIIFRSERPNEKSAA